MIADSRVSTERAGKLIPIRNSSHRAHLKDKLISVGERRGSKGSPNTANTSHPWCFRDRRFKAPSPAIFIGRSSAPAPSGGRNYFALGLGDDSGTEPAGSAVIVK
jgi:hypothetical protein